MNENKQQTLNELYKKILSNPTTPPDSIKWLADYLDAKPVKKTAHSENPNQTFEEKYKL